tara:strand:- start:583 stop:1062 length:480 start_codon:yes stop_codon:yes gene_type:complete
MTKFIFNAKKKRHDTPQETRSGSPKLDVYGAPLYSVQVQFDMPAMKIEAMKRLKLLTLLWLSDSDIFPSKLQSGLDPKAEPIKKVFSNLIEQMIKWDQSIHSNHIYESFIQRHNDLLDYIKAEVDDEHLQTLEDDYAIRITPKKVTKVAIATNLNNLIQ